MNRNPFIIEMRRSEWRKKPCPQCHAEIDERCKGVSGYRKSVHRARRYAPEPQRPNPLLRSAVVAPSDDRLNRLINLAVSEIEQLLRAQIKHYSTRCESPIEELFAAASLLHREGARHLGVEMYHFGSPFNREKRGCDWDSTDVYLQAQIGQYRADFLFDDLHEGKRFTGSEIYADPGECLQEVIDAILTARSDG
jgi:hypothetical protein